MLELKGIKVLSKEQQSTINGGDIMDNIVEWCMDPINGIDSVLWHLVCPTNDDDDKL